MVLVVTALTLVQYGKKTNTWLNRTHYIVDQDIQNTVCSLEKFGMKDLEVFTELTASVHVLA